MGNAGSVEVRVGAVTDRGRVRENNEDGYLVGASVFAVADGMGGTNAGEVASALALETLGVVAETAEGDIALSDWVDRANRTVFERAKEDQQTSGMGTTLVVVVPDGDNLRIAHVGDSRAYLLRDGDFSQLTEDHTKVQLLVKSGLISSEEAAHHPERNVITRALGVRETVDCDETTVAVREEDRLLLCTDGLSGMLEDDAIREILLTEPDPQTACERLVLAANEAGGGDNITAVVLDVTRVRRPLSELPYRAPIRWRWWAIGGIAGAIAVSLIVITRAGPSGPSTPVATAPVQTQTPTSPATTQVQAAQRVVDSLFGSLAPGWSSDAPFPVLAKLDGRNPNLGAISAGLGGECRDLASVPSFSAVPNATGVPSDLGQRLAGVQHGLDATRRLCSEMAGSLRAAARSSGSERDRLLRSIHVDRGAAGEAFARAYRLLGNLAADYGLRVPEPAVANPVGVTGSPSPGGGGGGGNVGTTPGS